MLFVQMHKEFGVRICAKAMLRLFQAFPMEAVVVDLAVANHRNRPIFIEQRLIATGDILHAQPHAAEGGLPMIEQGVPCCIGTAMCDTFAHRMEQGADVGGRAPLGDCRNSAHSCQDLSGAPWIG